MANIKSAIKRNRQNEKHRKLNQLYRSTASGYVRKANLAIQSGDVEKAKAATALASSALDRAAANKVIHKNNAARRKGALMAKVAAMGAPTQAQAAVVKPAAKPAKAKKAKAKKK